MSNNNINNKSSKSDHLFSTKVDRISNHLIKEISQGRFVPGQRLIESDLTKELGISRGPLREALQILATKGLLEIIPNRGARVKKLHPEDIRQRFQLLHTLGSMAIQNIAPEASELHGMEEKFSPQSDSPHFLISNLVNLYCGIARENNHILLAEYISKLNLSYFSYHIISHFNLNTRLLEIIYHNMLNAIRSGNHKTAFDEHQNLHQQLFSIVGLSTE